MRNYWGTSCRLILITVGFRLAWPLWFCFVSADQALSNLKPYRRGRIHPSRRRIAECYGTHRCVPYGCTISNLKPYRRGRIHPSRRRIAECYGTHRYVPYGCTIELKNNSKLRSCSTSLAKRGGPTRSITERWWRVLAPQGAYNQKPY